MGKQLLSVPSFTAGELSPQMEGRTDFQKYFNGCTRLENFVVLPHGPVTRRPGTHHVAEIKNSAAKTRLTSKEDVLKEGMQSCKSARTQPPEEIE